MNLKGIINSIKFILAYSAIIMVVVEIAQFAITKLEGIKLPVREIEPVQTVTAVEAAPMEGASNA